MSSKLIPFEQELATFNLLKAEGVTSLGGIPIDDLIEDIKLEARILKALDSYDDLLNNRRYES